MSSSASAGPASLPGNGPSRVIRALVPIADGSEDMETASITDVLVRAGVEVITASVMPRASAAGEHGDATVTMARGMKVVANGGGIAEALARYGGDFDALVFPGGMPGAAHLGDCAPLASFAADMRKRGRVVAAICAAPVVALAKNGLLDGVARVTCFPMMKDRLAVAGTEWVDESVVVARCAAGGGGGGGLVITSQGPGTSLLFALQVAAHIAGRDVAENVAKGMLVKDFAFIAAPTLVASHQ